MNLIDMGRDPSMTFYAGRNGVIELAYAFQYFTEWPGNGTGPHN
jgi:hypothetical protein